MMEFQNNLYNNLLYNLYKFPMTSVQILFLLTNVRTNLTR